MFGHTNDFEKPASNGTRAASITYLRYVDTRNRGEVIMNRIQKATAAAMALTITLLGAAFVTAPMALADVHSVALHQAMSAPWSAQPESSITAQRLRHG